MRDIAPMESASPKIKSESDSTLILILGVSFFPTSGNSFCTRFFRSVNSLVFVCRFVGDYPCRGGENYYRNCCNNQGIRDPSRESFV
jgi:hypothetical protein